MLQYYLQANRFSQPSKNDQLVKDTANDWKDDMVDSIVDRSLIWSDAPSFGGRWLQMGGLFSEDERFPADPFFSFEEFPGFAHFQL